MDKKKHQESGCCCCVFFFLSHLQSLLGRFHYLPRRIREGRQRKEKWQKMIRLDLSLHCIWGRPMVSRGTWLSSVKGIALVHLFPGSTHQAPSPQNSCSRQKLSYWTKKSQGHMWRSKGNFMWSPRGLARALLTLIVSLSRSVCMWSPEQGLLCGEQSGHYSYTVCIREHLARLNSSSELLLAKHGASHCVCWLIGSTCSKSLKDSLCAWMTQSGGGCGLELTIKQVFQCTLLEISLKMLWVSL